MPITPCDIVLQNAQQVMGELDNMVDRVDRARSTINSILQSAQDYMGDLANLLPDPSSLTPVSDIEAMLANLSASCPQFDLSEYEGLINFTDQMIQSYQSILNNALRDPLNSLNSLQDNLRRQFDTQKIKEKLDNLRVWLTCIETVCGSLEQLFPGKGGTADGIYNQYSENLAMNSDGQPQILSDTTQNDVNNYNEKVDGVREYMVDLEQIASGAPV